MARFASYDGTQIGYRELGDGPLLVCLPGGPGRAAEYFGDLGGLSRSRRLIMPDTRGTGESEDPSDPLSYRCDRLVGDVEALRAHLGLDRMDLLGHSAAGDLATLYAAAYPQRVARLILLTPGLDAVGIEETEEQWQAAVARRSAEPWYPAALAAVEKAEAGDESMENRRGYMPFYYGRWDDAAQAHVAVGVSERSRACAGTLPRRRGVQPRRDPRGAHPARRARAGVRGRPRRQSDTGERRGGRGPVPERPGDGSAGGRALPVGRRPRFFRRRDRLVPELNGIVSDPDPQAHQK